MLDTHGDMYLEVKHCGFCCTSYQLMVDVSLTFPILGVNGVFQLLRARIIFTMVVPQFRYWKLFLQSFLPFLTVLVMGGECHMV